MNSRILTLLLLLLPCALRAGLPEEAASANAALSAGRPEEALNSYRTLLTYPQFRNAGSAELWYNRGLAETKADDPVAASLSFRRALLLDPSLVPARTELSKTLLQLGVPESRAWNDRIPASLPPETLVIAGSLIGWGGVILFLLVFFLVPARRGVIVLSLLLIILGHGAAVAGTWLDPRRTARDMAVVTAKKAPTLRATPADSADSPGTLAPGTLVAVLSRNGAWWYVSGGQRLSGWIPSQTLTPLLASRDSS